ncbi:unnamed protein product, partial [Amoebophrya sp. A25]
QPSTYTGSKNHYYVIRNGSRGCMIQPGYPRVWPPNDKRNQRTKRRASSASQSGARRVVKNGGTTGGEQDPGGASTMLGTADSIAELDKPGDQEEDPETGQLRSVMRFFDRHAPPERFFRKHDVHGEARAEFRGRVLVTAEKLGILKSG